MTVATMEYWEYKMGGTEKIQIKEETEMEDIKGVFWQ